jgi:nicotinamide mononucleotide (NMN) deamidase PncC
MQTLIPLAQEVGKLLKARNEKISAPNPCWWTHQCGAARGSGASGWCLGGVVLYTLQSRLALKGIEKEMFEGMTGSTEVYALFMARAVRERFQASVLVRDGTAGPTGRRYGLQLAMRALR